MNKFYDSPTKALENLLYDGMTIMSGGFGVCGIPESLIYAIKQSKIKNLTIISNNCGTDEFGLGILLKSRQIKKIIASYVGENSLFKKQFLEKEVEAEFIPQGTLAEKIRAAGAGIPAFYTSTGIGTIIANNKEIREFNKKQYLLETALTADLAIIKGWKGDKSGNIVYNKTARNFNPIMATAAKHTICEVEQILETGCLDPNNIHTPNIFIDKVILSTINNKHIENKIIKKDI